MKNKWVKKRVVKIIFMRKVGQANKLPFARIIYSNYLYLLL